MVLKSGQQVLRSIRFACVSFLNSRSNISCFVFEPFSFGVLVIIKNRDYSSTFFEMTDLTLYDSLLNFAYYYPFYPQYK